MRLQKQHNRVATVSSQTRIIKYENPKYKPYLKQCKWDVQYQTTDWWRTYRSQAKMESVYSRRLYYGLGIDPEIPEFVKRPQSRVLLPDYTEAHLKRKEVASIGAQISHQSID